MKFIAGPTGRFGRKVLDSRSKQNRIKVKKKRGANDSRKFIGMNGLAQQKCDLTVPIIRHSNGAVSGISEPELWGIWRVIH